MPEAAKPAIFQFVMMKTVRWSDLECHDHTFARTRAACARQSPVPLAPLSAPVCSLVAPPLRSRLWSMNVRCASLYPAKRLTAFVFLRGWDREHVLQILAAVRA